MITDSVKSDAHATFLFGTKILGEEFQNLEVTMVIIIVTSVVVLGGLFLKKDINPEKDKERYIAWTKIIDDMPENIQECKKQGMHGIVFKSIDQDQLKKLLEKLCLSINFYLNYAKKI